MVSKADVTFAYRLLLGREPENDAVVRAHADGHGSLADLRRAFLTSDEFISRYPALARNDAETRLRPLHWSADVTWPPTDDTLLAQLMARIGSGFTHLGETEPHWSVLTADEYKSRNIATHEEQFFASGKELLDHLREAARRHDLALRYAGTCLELGCGIGRCTIWLARAFSEVAALDISAPHLRLARDVAARSGLDNIDWRHVGDPRDFIALPECDVFVSAIVLQHNPPPLMAHVLRGALNALRPGGVAYFQLPTAAEQYRFELTSYLARPADPNMPEMHVLPQPMLFQILREHGCELLELREDASSGPAFVSNWVLACKMP